MSGGGTPCSLKGMGTLAELQLSTDDAPIMLIAPSDEALAEAAAMRPRPSVASSLLVAEPTARIVWWAARDDLTPGDIERFRWMVTAVQGAEAWVVLDPEDTPPITASEFGALLDGSGLRADGERTLASGETAVRVIGQAEQPKTNS